MLLLTLDAVVSCDHAGRVALTARQRWVTVEGRPFLVKPDPVGRSISACPNVGGTMKPCQKTLNVEVGYSTFVSIDGHAVVLDDVTGKTDGTPPGVVQYHSHNPGQHFVGSEA